MSAQIEESAETKDQILDIKKFAHAFSKKVVEKRWLLRHGYMFEISDAISQMLQEELIKGNWTKK